MKERRRFARLSEVWPVKYRILGATKDKQTSRTVNVSSGGVRFYTNAILEPDTLLELELLVPASSSPAQITGRVVWQGKVVWCKESKGKERWPLEIGVEFVDIDDYDKERLIAYINSHLDKQEKSRGV